MRPAFTLVELVLVLGIIVILALIVLVAISGQKTHPQLCLKRDNSMCCTAGHQAENGAFRCDSYTTIRDE